jgi:hypothetical protein
LIDAFDALLEEAGSVCAQQRGRDRLRAHLLGQLVCLGEHTLSGLLCATGQQFGDWTADYRFYSGQRADPQRLFGAVRRDLEGRLPPGQPLVVALDDSILRKRGPKIPGVAWRPDPLGAPFQVNFVRAQRVVQLAAALPAGTEGAARTVPIDFAQAPSASRPRKTAPADAWEAFRSQQKVLNINRQAGRRLQALQAERTREAQARPLWVTVDGRFTNKTFLKNAPPEAVVIGRIRGDARLHAAVAPSPPMVAGGRPRRYGPALPTPESLRQDDQIPWQPVEAYAAGRRHTFKIKTLDAVRWRVTGALRTLRLIVVAPLGYRLHKGGRMLYRKPAYLICTDPSLSVAQVLQAYLWRWGIEVNFRDEKTLLGVGQARVRHPQSVQRVPELAVAAYAMLLIAAVRAHGVIQLPPPAWRQHPPTTHATTATLISQLRYELWADQIRPGFCDFTHTTSATQKSQQPSPHLESAVLYALAG